MTATFPPSPGTAAVLSQHGTAANTHDPQFFVVGRHTEGCVGVTGAEKSVRCGVGGGKEAKPT